MDKAITHEIGNYLHQIISNADYIISHNKSSEYAEKIKNAAYKIDALLTDSTSDKNILHDRKVSAKRIDFKQFKGLRVLIVDDLEENIYIMENIFKTLSFEIVTAMSGEEALDIYNKGYSPDIVCMDMMMPGIDGFTTTSELKLLGCDAYFIAISALKNQTHDIVAIFDSWLPKPFSMEHVNGALMGYSIKKRPKRMSENYILGESVEPILQEKIYKLAKQGAYSKLKKIIETLPSSQSKQFLQKALSRVDLDAITNSIVSS